MRKFVFYSLTIICIPLFLIGLFTYMLPVLQTRGKVSGTAYEPFNARLQWDMLGLREDSAARALSRGLPATNLLTRLLVFRVVWLICKISGYISPPMNFPADDNRELSSMVAARTEFFDRVMSETLRDGDQVVLLGAGWDTRAWGLLKNGKTALKIFEVDSPATQQVKRHALNKAGIDHDNVTFVTCDFNKESWLEKLQTQGFDIDCRTFVLWEGVTMYLEESAIHATLASISKLANDSLIAFDFLPEHWWTKTKLGHRSASSIAVTYGEKFTYFVEDQHGVKAGLATLLQDHNLMLQEKLVQYLKNDEDIAFYGMALARKPGEIDCDSPDLV